MSHEKITDGLNDRPKDAPIGQSAEGLPDDSSQPLEVAWDPSDGGSDMADDSVKTITGLFETREEADIAIEHLVQQHGIARADIFIQPRDNANSAGTRPSGGDASHDAQPRSDGALEGALEVSADVKPSDIEKARHAYEEAGAHDVKIH